MNINAVIPDEETIRGFDHLGAGFVRQLEMAAAAPVRAGPEQAPALAGGLCVGRRTLRDKVAAIMTSWIPK